MESVANASGYPSVNNFFIAFKQLSGFSPAEFRKQARSGIGS
ncbi:MAG: hypothetical protein V4640_11545 [Verrucomicrobiota bacterium]